MNIKISEHCQSKIVRKITNIKYASLMWIKCDNCHTQVSNVATVYWDEVFEILALTLNLNFNQKNIAY